MTEGQEETKHAKRLLDKAQEICDLTESIMDKLKVMDDKINGIDGRLKEIERDKGERDRSIRAEFIGMLKGEFPSLFIEYNKDYNRIDINKIPFASPPFAYVVIHTGMVYSKQDLLNLIGLVKQDITDKEAEEGG